MWRKIDGLNLVMLFTASVVGCSLIQTTESTPIEQDEQPEAILVVDDPVLLAATEEFLRKHDPQGPERSRQKPGLDLQQLAVGQNVKLVAKEKTDADVPASIVIYSSSFAGKVKALEEHNVVLQDVVMITEHRSESGVPIVSKVPYVSRLFTNVGIAQAGRRIPGDVTFEKSRIMRAVELSDEEFRNLPITENFERMGVDFDYAAEGEP